MGDFLIRGQPSQHQDTRDKFNLLFRAWLGAGLRVRHVVEIGTGSGEFSLWIRMHPYIIASDGSFVSYDVITPERADALVNSGITYVVADAFECRERIEGEIQQIGTTLLLCDGGDKPREVREFAPLLKSGDIVMAHDYAPTRALHATAPVWVACEITDVDIADVCLAHRIEPFMQGIMQPVAWMCRRKA